MQDAVKLAALFSDEVWQRVHAAETMPATEPGVFALRDAALGDGDGNVRREAVGRLGAFGGARLVPWLLEATLDPLPSVRDVAWRALARLRSPESAREALGAYGRETVWWVRRALVLSAAAAAGEEALGLLREALGDPFWRVRHAAALVLHGLGCANPSLRAAVLAVDGGTPPAAVAALRYLSERWDAGLDDDPARFQSSAPREDDGLWNPDPAVITARLEARAPGSVEPALLVEFLADPHEPLRRQASRHLRARAGLGALDAAAQWLEHPRVPHARDEAEALLDRAGSAVGALVPRWLADPSRPGAAVYAAAWVARRALEAHAPALGALSEHPRGEVRAAALRALDALELAVPFATARLRDPDPEALTAAVQALASADAEVCEGLAYLALPAGARAALLSRAEEKGLDGTLEAALEDPHPRLRATAAEALARRGRLPEEAREALARSPDPLLRRAALTPESAQEALVTDPDPRVRRQALRKVLSVRRALPSRAREALVEALLKEPDRWVRSRAARLLTPEESGRSLALLLALFADRDPTVRRFAELRLDTAEDLDARLRDALEDPESALQPSLARAAWTLLARPRAVPDWRLVVAAARAEGTHPAVREHLQLLAWTYDPALQAEAPDVLADAPKARSVAPPTAPRTAEVPRRALGGSDVKIAPCVLSGVGELPERALASALRAGVDTLFWEPRYRAMTTFLQGSLGQRAQVVAGTYEASPLSITRDVERALRRLRRTSLDVFLLFWVRSPERLGAEAFEALTALKRAGKVRAVGFSTHHRELACEALRARPWDVVMTRHSAAHPGAEAELLPLARARGAGVLSFSAVCYGRMVSPLEGGVGAAPLPTAPECYRYVLSQPGVSGVVFAPRSADALGEDLSVLAETALGPARQAALRAHGAGVREAGRRFQRYLRQPQGATLNAVTDTALALLDALPEQAEVG
ncbi:MAG: HEAT repeat domain-containing protein [Deltaproteobacteria bacterium]|nr:HEAT repeat domain-containing protein [Deltaproteobacteria bacterium]